MRTVFKQTVLISLIVFVSAILPVGQAAAGESGSNSSFVRLQILTVNDFHGALMENGKDPGAAKLVAYLKEAKTQDPDGTILISAGDMFEGTIDSNLLYGKPVVDIMNYVQFDAMTLGNHEFDWGIDKLKQRITQSKFPYVCANVIEKSTGKPLDFVKPYAILKCGGLKIAVVGIATPETAYKTNPKAVAGYMFSDPATVVHALVPEIKRHGADIIVVLTHLPSWQDGSGSISGDAATLALEARGIDAIVSGHSHQTVCGKVNDVPVVQAYYNGRAVGKIELLFDKSIHQVAGSTVSVTTLPYPGLLPDPGAQTIVNHAQAEIAPIKNVVVGQTLHPLSHDRYSLTETLLGQWVTDTMRQAAGAEIAFLNSGGLRTGFPAGDITIGNLYQAMPFDDKLVTVEMTGEQVMKLLGYGIMNQKFGMVQYSGLKVSYNAGPQGGKIVAVTMPDGTPLCLEKHYKVVTDDFMAAGGDGFTMFKEGQNLHDTCISLRDVLADAIRNQKTIDFSSDDRWKVMTTSCNQRQDAA